jgi:hypothetical protein
VIKFNAMSFCLVLACAICSHPMVTIVRNKDDNGRESASLLADTCLGDLLAVIVRFRFDKDHRLVLLDIGASYHS